ncbi:glycoside hydrolase family 16 protein [Mycena filopes]|nr:glycoside hydrolase family 16 protein [Mycena filopes]
MFPSNPTTTFGVLALVASASASLNAAGLRRAGHHARVAHQAAPEWKRADVSGVAYYGYQNSTQNACGTYSSDDDMIIGVGPDYYGDMGVASSKCFQHITVALASDPSKTVDVTLTDACEGCGEPGNVYISPAAFKALNGGSLDAGVIDVTWSFGSSSSSTEQSSSSSTTSSSSSSSDEDSSSSSNDEDEEDCDDEDESSTDEEAGATTEKAAATTAKAAAPKATTSTTKSTAKATSTPASTKSSSAGWKLSNTLEGQAFLDFFNYDSGSGDNGGVANYVNGISQGLAYKSGDQVILAVDDAEDVATRNALRMVSKKTFNAKDENLFIFDIAHMPAVCGTWPAVWFTGANWPYQGEIDVVEGVSLYNQNIYSIHTGSGCSIPSSSVSSMTQVKIVSTEGDDCDATVNPAACGFSDKSAATFGPGFNAAGGGVYALQFDTSGIKMWFFQAGKVPSDISSKDPNPANWGSPRMAVPTSSCSPTTYFQDLMMVVDTNLGGSFTEGVWAVDGAGGQSKSCKTSTGSDTAAEYIKSHGSEFGAAAQWKINGFYVYNQ